MQTAHCTPRAQPVERSIAAVAIAEQKKNRKTSLSFIHTLALVDCARSWWRVFVPDAAFGKVTTPRRLCSGTALASHSRDVERING